jgi:precorrin-2/cobalt-factor-2 C20-methyltransferase
MKATRPRRIAEELRNRGYNEFVLGVNLCTPDERIIYDDMPERSDYFSVLLARRR